MQQKQGLGKIEHLQQIYVLYEVIFSYHTLNNLADFWYEQGIKLLLRLRHATYIKAKICNMSVIIPKGQVSCLSFPDFTSAHASVHYPPQPIRLSPPFHMKLKSHLL